jgi:hypothetical protein
MMPTALPFTLDGRVLGFTIAISVGAALLISVVPIVHILRANLMQLVHRSSRGASGSAGVRALSSILIIGQVAFTLMLLTGAGLLIHSFMNAIAVDPGFDPNGVVAGRVAIPQAHRASGDAAKALLDRVEQTMKEIPGVSSMALSFAVPFQGGLPVNALQLESDTLPPGSPQPGAFIVVASPDYLETLRLRLVEGRFSSGATPRPVTACTSSTRISRRNISPDAPRSADASPSAAGRKRMPTGRRSSAWSATYRTTAWKITAAIPSSIR